MHHLGRYESIPCLHPHPPPPPPSRVNHRHAFIVYVVNKAVDKGHWKCGSYSEKSYSECHECDVVLLEKVPGGTDSVGACIVLLERDAGDGQNRAQYEVEGLD